MSVIRTYGRSDGSSGSNTFVLTSICLGALTGVAFAKLILDLREDPPSNSALTRIADYISYHGLIIIGAIAGGMAGGTIASVCVIAQNALT